MIIWCVEDDASIRRIEEYALQNAGYETEGFDNGLDVIQALKTRRPDLVLLDIMLPGADGLQVLKALKSTALTHDVPVMMVTAKGTEFDTVTSLDSGADDHLSKPFGMMELLARVKALLRRSTSESANLRLGDLVLDAERRSVTADGQALDLTLREFELLRLFMTHPGKAWSREALYRALWGEDMTDSRTLDVHIRSLRAKLGPRGSMVQTVRGLGYRFEEVHDTKNL